MQKTGRNDPCPCGSGRKYKKCCLLKTTSPVESLGWRMMRRTESELIHTLMGHVDKYYGPGAMHEAWDEFTLWPEAPLDMESEPEVDTLFFPWFAFNWIPDNTGLEKAERHPEMQVAMHYLKHSGARIGSYQRQFIEEACSQPYSFFVVTRFVSGKQLRLRDLLLKREVTVHELRGSTTVSRGAILYARIITVDGDSIMLGCASTIIPPSYLDVFVDEREAYAEECPGYGQDYLLECDLELREIYYDIREQLFNPTLPELQNTDGEPLQLTKLHYRLKCTPGEGLDALATLALAGDANELGHEGEFDEQGELVSIGFPWLKEGNKQHEAWENTVLGNIAIDGERLTIEVNSRERADTIKRKIVRRLGKRAEFCNADILSTEKLFEEMERPPDEEERLAAQNEELMAMPEVQEQLEEMAEQHKKEWPDKPIPALKDQSPREAARTAAGRELLEALLWHYEWQSEKLKTPQQFQLDITEIRKTLLMEE